MQRLRVSHARVAALSLGGWATPAAGQHLEFRVAGYWKKRPRCNQLGAATVSAARSDGRWRVWHPFMDMCVGVQMSGMTGLSVRGDAS
jgi:hypothetical protein